MTVHWVTFKTSPEHEPSEESSARTSWEREERITIAEKVWFEDGVGRTERPGCCEILRKIVI